MTTNAANAPVESMTFTYEGFGTKVTKTINRYADDCLFVEDILDDFSGFLRASGYDYMRMYPTDEDSWVFDKEYYREYEGTNGPYETTEDATWDMDAFEPSVTVDTASDRESLKVGDYVRVSEDHFQSVTEDSDILPATSLDGARGIIVRQDDWYPGWQLVSITSRPFEGHGLSGREWYIKDECLKV